MPALLSPSGRRPREAVPRLWPLLVPGADLHSGLFSDVQLRGLPLYLCGSLSLGRFASRARGGGAGSHLALWTFSPGVSHGHGYLIHSFRHC